MIEGSIVCVGVVFVYVFVMKASVASIVGERGGGGEEKNITFLPPPEKSQYLHAMQPFCGGGGRSKLDLTIGEI